MFAYEYDALGRRTKKLNNNGSYILYTYSQQDAVLERHYNKNHILKQERENIFAASTDEILASYVTTHSILKTTEEYINSRGKTKTRTIKTPIQDTELYYYEADHLGSIVAISDDMGTIIEQYDYDVFGKAYML